jgi:hypothetical protein
MAAGVVHIPWYATVFRGDKFETALLEIAPHAVRYGATEWEIYRSKDDQYKFLQLATFAEKADFEAYWYGADFNDWRARYSSWYQVPVLSVWHDLIGRGGLAAPAEVEA